MIKISTDAAFNPKSCQAGIGIIIQNKDIKEIKIHYHRLFDNHLAEFIALYEALKQLEPKDFQEIIFYQADSKIVIDALEKEYVKHAEYSKLLEAILGISQDIPQFYFKWVPEAQNKGADNLSRQALHKEGKYIEKRAFEF